MVPLVIPVSVPVHRGQTDPQGGWAQGRPGQGERPAAPSDRKPSVIVARRRSLRSTMTESFAQVSSLRTRDLNCFPFSHFKGTFFLFFAYHDETFTAVVFVDVYSGLDHIA